MATYLFKRLLLLFSFYVSPYLLPLSITPNFRIKSVSIGGWLVYEGAAKPLLFEGIPNKDLLDGTRLKIKAVKVGMYLKAMEGGGDDIVANQAYPWNYETHRLWRVNETTFQIRTDLKWFWSLDGVNVVALSKKAGPGEMFQIVRRPDNLNRMRIKAPNGRFIQVTSMDRHGVTADFDGEGDWSDNDPSVFESLIDVALHGEYQLLNGYGPEKTPQIMKDHWETFITEEDFKFVADSGLNAVRIPVGWWIAKDPNPPKPYIGGSSQYLDKAFAWANKYGLRVIINLHAARCSQNGYDHTSSIDGMPEWGSTEENIQETVDVIEFLAARYSKNPSLVAISLMNEPLAPYVTLESLTKYYTGAYNAIRKYSSTIYVIMQGRIGDADSMEIFPLASSLKGAVIDVHLYNLFDSAYESLTVQENIDLIYSTQAEKLALVTKTNGPLTFVGEWSDEWEVVNATKEDYKRYAEAQLDVYARATLGWAYWSLKHYLPHWSLEYMIKNDYIKV